MQLNDQALVSVIIPVYKVEKYLEKCFISVVNQSYQNLEIILVDDGSPDKCGELCETLALRDNRVKVVHKENGGLSSARNAGMEVAHGDFYYFLDSDDYIENNLIEKCYQSMVNENSDMTVFNFIHFTDADKTWTTKHFSKGFYSIKNEKERLRIIINDFFKYSIGYEAWNRMYRADIIKTHNIKFAPNKLVFSEDICFNLCYLMYCNKITVLDDYLLHYRIREDSIMGKSKQIIKIKEFTELGKYVYERIQNDDNLVYIKKNFFMIQMLLVEIQLMRVSIMERNQYIIKDTFLIENLEKQKRNIFLSMHVMGIARGLKYSLLARLYMKYNNKLAMVLKKILREN